LPFVKNVNHKLEVARREDWENNYKTTANPIHVPRVQMTDNCGTPTGIVNGEMKATIDSESSSITTKGSKGIFPAVIAENASIGSDSYTTIYEYPEEGSASGDICELWLNLNTTGMYISFEIDGTVAKFTDFDLSYVPQAKGDNLSNMSIMSRHGNKFSICFGDRAIPYSSSFKVKIKSKSGTKKLHRGLIVHTDEG